MPRTVKRYESRKLYDSQESRYVSLQEIAAWIRDGQEIEVIDNATDEVVTSQTLAQIILDEGRSGRSRLSPELLHDLVRASGEKISSGVTQVQKGLNRLVQASFDRLGPVKEAREEMSVLRQRLDELETMLTSLEEGRAKKGTAKKVAKRAAKKSAEAPETKGENTEEA